jgi:hypothetical protein
MTETAHDHPLVRDYLRGLDLAFAWLPAARAKELREQIAAHLDDELAPGATDDEVADALRRLGTPAELAAEARSNRAPVVTAADAVHWVWSAIVRRTWKFWTVLSALVLLASGIAWYVVSVENAPALNVVQVSWWYKQDQIHQVSSNAEDSRQSTVPLRPGQRQGYYVLIWNDSRWTQTVTGYAPGSDPAPGVCPNGNFEFNVSTSNAIGHTTAPGSLRYGLPVSIPPDQARFIRVLWVSAGSCSGKGGESGTDQMELTVRIGWTTRTEIIPLPVGMYLLDTKTPGAHR